MKLFKTFGKVKLPLPKALEKKYSEEIKFLGWDIEPCQIFSSSIIFPVIVFSAISLLSVVLGIFSFDLVLTFILLSLVLIYFLLNYTTFLSKYIRAKASSEIVLSIIYMAISMRINQNLEKAVEFAASSLEGPIGKDLRKALFNIKTGKSFSIKEELNKIADKWKLESQEFVDAINIIKECTDVTKEELERNLKEAIDVIMNGTKRRMKEYALRMKTPVTIVNAFGILMPLLFMIFLPVGIIFLPEVFRQVTITSMYIFVLPSIVYMFLLQNFYSRPYSYHQISINLTHSYKRKKILYLIIVSLIFIVFLVFLLRILISSKNFDFRFLFSIGITNLIGVTIIIYIYLIQLEFEKVSEKIFKYEEELPTVLYQISMEASTGKPLESVFEVLQNSIKTLNIAEFFKELIYSLKLRGDNLREALFNKDYGIIKKYPSKLLSSCMKAIVDISEKGSYYVSETLKSIASYLDNAIEVNKFTDEVLSETTSEMKITSYIFAPLAGGIIVGMMSILIMIFLSVQGQLEESLLGIPKQQLSEIISIIGWILELPKQISLEYFQIVIGIYVIEMVLILSWFLGEITYGEDEIRKLKEIGKYILISLLIYTFISLSIYGIIRVLLYSTQTI
ncbi:MAG: hypothetical protein QXU71_01515 [Candidatus Aenigmatarchaeota archaeon]